MIMRNLHSFQLIFGASALSVLALLPTGCANTVPSPPPAVSSSGAIPVPAKGAYWGAWANPGGTNINSQPTVIESNTEALEAQLGQTLRIHLHYHNWGTGTTPSFPDDSMQSDIAAGRTPVVTWGCGDTNANVAAGADDALIIATANAVKQFGAPMFIRWYWEMNLAAGTNGQDCMGTGGAAGYIAAWQHIYNVFAAQGVTNVSWLWNPAGGSPNEADPAVYYPGAQYVDWIGFDGYDKVGANDFGLIYGYFHAEFGQYGKPVMVAETGECATEQSAFISSAQAEIEGASNSGNYYFPEIKGLMYFSAPGQTSPCPWVLTGSGITAYSAMGNDPFFQIKP